MLLVDNVDNKDFLTRLFVAMYDELPAQKKEEVIKSRFAQFLNSTQTAVSVVPLLVLCWYNRTIK